MKADSRLEEVEQAAAQWLVRRESSSWTDADELALAQWLQSSTGHRVAFARLSLVWREANRLQVLRTRGEVPARGTILASPFFARKVRASAAADAHDAASRRPGWRIAAAIALAGVLGAIIHLWSDDAPVYRTAIGALATLPVEDGSVITLNTQTEISLRITATERRVDLRRGEAFFRVAKDPSRPFIVYADDQRVIAVGTQFSVRLKEEGVQVAVTEGQVRLEERRSRLPFQGESPPAVGAPLLTPGTLANASKDTVTLEQLPLPQIEQALSWRGGFVQLRDVSLRDAVAEFNRYNRRQLVIEDAALEQEHVGGNFQATNIDGFVRLLEAAFQVEAETRGEQIRLRRKHADGEQPP